MYGKIKDFLQSELQLQKITVFSKGKELSLRRKELKLP